MQSATGVLPPTTQRPVTVRPNGLVRVRVHQRNGVDVGSGVLIAPRLVLTCNHVVSNHQRGQVRVSSSKKTLVGKVVKQDSIWDLALVQLTDNLNLKHVELASERPKGGDTLTAYGYGGDGRAKSATGRVVGFTKPVNPNIKHWDWITVTGSVRQGDSGGPIYTTQGKLAGIVWGANRGTFSGTQLGRCKLFCKPWLRKILPPYRKSPPNPDVSRHKTIEQLQQDIDDLRAQVVDLKEQQSKPGPQGPRGPRGPQGPKGDKGEPGPSLGEIDYEKLAKHLSGEITVRVSEK